MIKCTWVGCTGCSQCILPSPVPSPPPLSPPPPSPPPIHRRRPHAAVAEFRVYSSQCAGAIDAASPSRLRPTPLLRSPCSRLLGGARVPPSYSRRVGTAALRVCGAGRWLSLRSTRPRRRRSRASSLTQPRRHWSRASLSPPRRHQCRARSLASPRRLWSRARHPTPPRRLRSRARRATWPRRHQRHASSLRTPRLAVADADRAARPGLASSGAECGPTRAPQPRRPRPARQSASPQAHATTACPGPRANACRSSASRVWLAAAAAQLRYDDARRGYRDATPPRCGPEHECWRSTSHAPRTSRCAGSLQGCTQACTRQTSRAARTAADAVALRLERLRPLAASHGFAS